MAPSACEGMAVFLPRKRRIWILCEELLEEEGQLECPLQIAVDFDAPLDERFLEGLPSPHQAGEGRRIGAVDHRGAGVGTVLLLHHDAAGQTIGPPPTARAANVQGE